jgi:hypothetical protein
MRAASSVFSRVSVGMCMVLQLQQRPTFFFDIYFFARVSVGMCMVLQLRERSIYRGLALLTFLSWRAFFQAQKLFLLVGAHINVYTERERDEREKGGWGGGGEERERER